MGVMQAVKQLMQRDRLQAFAWFLWRRFRDDKCFETAGALSYSTLFALVPMLTATIAVFAVFPAFAPMRERLSDFVFHAFVPAAGNTVQGYLFHFADNASKLTVVGIGFLLVTAVTMLASIEDRFNRIWRAPARRRGAARWLMYLGAIILGPLSMVLAAAASSWLLAQLLLRGAGAVLPMAHLTAVLPFVIAWGGLAALYRWVPNCRVHWHDAVAGALVSALLFELARHGFAWYVHGVASYRAVYGALAAIPILLIWIYLSWVIVLLGATVAAALAAFEYGDPRVAPTHEVAS